MQLIPDRIVSILVSFALIHLTKHKKSPHRSNQTNSIDIHIPISIDGHTCPQTNTHNISFYKYSLLVYK